MFSSDIDDEYGPLIATTVYEAIMKKDHLDLNVIPYALEDAMQALRERGVRPHLWAPYIHIGA